MSTWFTPNEDEIGVKVKLVRQPLSVQGNDHHRAERLLLHPARSSLLEESSEARIKVPIGNMIPGGGRKGRASGWESGLCLPGFCAFTISVPPPTRPAGR